MADFITFTIRGADLIRDRLLAFRSNIPRRFREYMVRAWRRARERAPRDKGQLVNTIVQTVEGTDHDTLIGRLGAGTVYARILELGGVIPSHVVVPRTPGGVLAFPIGGTTVFAKYAVIPPVRIFARRYLQSSLEDELPSLYAAIESDTAGANR